MKLSLMDGCSSGTQQIQRAVNGAEEEDRQSFTASYKPQNGDTSKLSSSQFKSRQNEVLIMFHTARKNPEEFTGLEGDGVQKLNSLHTEFIRPADRNQVYEGSSNVLQH